MALLFFSAGEAWAQATATFTPSPTPTATRTPTGIFTPIGTPTPTPTIVPIIYATIGPENPLDSTRPPGTYGLPILQVRLTNPMPVAAAVTTAILSFSGTGNDAGIFLIALQDMNSNGSADTGDMPLATGSALSDDGSVTLTGNWSIGPGAAVDVLLIADFQPSIPSGTYQAALTALEATMGAQAIFVTGAPVPGAVVTIAQPSPTMTPTPPPGSGPVYRNTETDVAAALGCTVEAVERVRSLYLDDVTSYMIMRLTALCGCTPQDILSLRLTMGWDEICAFYGLDWSDFAADLQARMDALQPEMNTPEQILRAAANDPSQYPIEYPSPMPDTVGTGTTIQEVCPQCP